jgi:hypothetical protein
VAVPQVRLRVNPNPNPNPKLNPKLNPKKTLTAGAGSCSSAAKALQKVFFGMRSFQRLWFLLISAGTTGQLCSNRYRRILLGGLSCLQTAWSGSLLGLHLQDSFALSGSAGYSWRGICRKLVLF